MNNDMHEVTLVQALELLIRAAHQKDFDNVIYFATRIKEESKNWKAAQAKGIGNTDAQHPQAGADAPKPCAMHISGKLCYWGRAVYCGGRQCMSVPRTASAC